MKILIQTPMDLDNLLQEQMDIIDKIPSGEVSFFSPSIFLMVGLSEGRSEIGTVLSVATGIYNNPSSIPWIDDAKVKVYFGLAPNNIEFDNIIIYKKDTLSTQEAYLKYELGEEDYKEWFGKMYSSEDGEIYFDDFNLLTEYLLLVISNELRA